MHYVLCSFEWDKKRRAEEIERHYLAMEDDGGMEKDVANTLCNQALRDLEQD